MANLNATFPNNKTSFRSKISVAAHVPAFPRFIEVHEQKDGTMAIMCYIERPSDNLIEPALCTHEEVKAAIEQTVFTGPW